MFTAWVWNDEYFEPHWQSDSKLIYVVGWGTKQGRFDFFNKIWKTGCLNFTCKDVQIKWKERYLAYVSLIAKTTNEIKRLVWMCSNRWLPPSLPWCLMHSSFPFFHTNFSQQFKLWSQTQVIILRNFHIAFAHASKASKTNTDPIPFKRLMCVNMRWHATVTLQGELNSNVFIGICYFYIFFILLDSET